MLAGMFARLLALSMLALAAGCQPTIPEGRYVCTVDEDCPPEFVCRTRSSRCYSTETDAGTSDGG